MGWVEGVLTVRRGPVISVDGKTARGSQDEANGPRALHLVSAWASANGVLIGQRKVAEKSNEITALYWGWELGDRHEQGKREAVENKLTGNQAQAVHGTLKSRDRDGEAARGEGHGSGMA
jgi:hypothetical protein